MEDRTGQWLAGRYRLDRRLATDTTGDRYEAWDGAALLRVVVHLLAPAMLELPDAATRYEEQVGRLRAFDHRGIIAGRGIEREGATLFLRAGCAVRRYPRDGGGERKEQGGGDGSHPTR